MNILIQPNTQCNTRYKPFRNLNAGDVFTLVDPFAESFNPLTNDNKLKPIIYMKADIYGSIDLRNGSERTISVSDMVYDVTDICNIVLTR
jgi:hypothetical protein